ncbi:MAG: hypothetical protein PHY28_05445 [Dehalococcoidales bacterium]|nr:hypothetical protein [Dehalococcoidales bacterium]
MGFGIILIALFILIAIGILMLIIGMLVLGFRKISRMGKPGEKQAPVKTDAENPAPITSPREPPATTDDNSPKSLPQN